MFSSCLGDFSSGTSGFLPQSKHKHVRFIDDSKLFVGVNVTVSVKSCPCLSVLAL